jgi:curved DNA-binding protein CbpA
MVGTAEELNRAWEVLGDEGRRKEYDEARRGALRLLRTL